MMLFGALKFTNEEHDSFFHKLKGIQMGFPIEPMKGVQWVPSSSTVDGSEIPNNNRLDI